MKRARTSSQPRDRVTLNVGGTRFETSRVTLGSAVYFSRMLDGAWQESSDDDEIFIDRDGALFVHILEWLRTGQLPRFPKYSADPGLWKALRLEAEYFCIETLVAYLQTTHSCRFQETGDERGLLYWLGTAKGTEPYKNPHLSGAVRVESHRTIKVDVHTGNACNDFPRMFSGQHEFIARESLLMPMEDNHLHCYNTNSCDLLFCADASNPERYARVDLRNVLLRPSHYTLAYSGECWSPDTWDFSASEDGVTWDVLHAARFEEAFKIRSMTQDEDHKKYAEELKEALDEEEDLPEYEKERARQLNEGQLRDFRRRFHHTWKLDPPPEKFYRFFRISGIQQDEFAKLYQEADAKSEALLAADPKLHSWMEVGTGRHNVCSHAIGGVPCSCLHVCALELYGDVHEVEE